MASLEKTLYLKILFFVVGKVRPLADRFRTKTNQHHSGPDHAPMPNFSTIGRTVRPQTWKNTDRPTDRPTDRLHSKNGLNRFLLAQNGYIRCYLEFFFLANTILQVLFAPLGRCFAPTRGCRAPKRGAWHLFNRL